MANAYMTALNKARKAKAKSFTYKGSTYVMGTTKTGLIIYKKKGSTPVKKKETVDKKEKK